MMFVMKYLKHNVYNEPLHLYTDIRNSDIFGIPIVYILVRNTAIYHFINTLGKQVVHKHLSYQISLPISYLLCVSCPSAIEFSAIVFLLFARSSSNSPRSFQRFRQTLRQNFNWIRQQMKNFTIDPYYKNCPRAIFTMGVYGEILYLLSV